MDIEIIPKPMHISVVKINNLMKLYKDHTNTGKWIKKKIKTRIDINTCTIMYHAVAVPFSQYRISNFNTNINEYFNKRKLKRENQKIGGFLLFFWQNILIPQNQTY